MDVILQQTVNGITIGMGYVLVAVGLSLIFGVLHIINFSHGEFYMLGGYGVYMFTQYFSLSYVTASILSVLIVTGGGWGVQKIAIRPVVDKNTINAILTTFACSLFFINLTQAVFTATAKPIDSPYNETFRIGNLFTTYQKIGILLVGVIILLAMHVFMKKTVWGKMMRATAQNQFASAVIGIQIKKMYSLSFSLGAGLAALAGVLIAPTTGIFPMVGQVVLLKAFIVIILGGLGNVFGAVLGGLFLGLVEAFSTNFLSTAWAGMVGYVFLILTLLIRPSGLFGNKGSEKH